MVYGKYKNARDTSWQCLIDYNVTSLPVKILDIAKRSGIKVIKNSLANKLITSQKGQSYINQDETIIIYDDTLPKTVIRYTVAHELGHIFLGHDLAYPTIEMENEANVFSSRLLAPACVLWGLNLHTPQEIATICDISLQSAEIRAERIKILYKRNKFLTSPLEKQVYENFKGFINEKRKIPISTANTDRDKGIYGL